MAAEPPQPGRVERLAAGLRRVIAPNPGPLTLHGTNSYIVGDDRVAVIDPGPDIPAHLDALEAALAPGERIAAVLVTHAHRDHAPLARALAQRWEAPVLAFGGATAGRSALMETLAAAGDLGGGEGIDAGFSPDRRLADGEEVDGPGWRLRALHTPGHMGSHLCFLWQDVAFSGDHVMGWASTLVSPPDGDMGAYMKSLDRLATAGARVLYPGHGAPVTHPATRIAELAAHRRAREAAILGRLGSAPQTVPALTRAIYTDTPPALLPAAERNVLAHLLDLVARDRARCDDPPGPAARFRLP